MNEISFKVKLARIKQDFHAKLIAHKRSSLAIQQVAQLLYKYMNGQPLTIKQTLLRSSGKTYISWDDLLQFLQEQFAIIQSVKKIEYSPLSATEIIQNQTNQFTKLLNYIKMKQTNTIQSIHHVPSEVSGDKIIAVCFQKEILFYDYGEMSIISHHGFKYTHMKDKIMDKAEQKKIHLLNSQQINIQFSDHVEQIINLPNNNNKNVRNSTNFLTNNIKNSVRGSSLSSQKSNNQNKLKFRRNTESIERKKIKTTTKIKNDDIKKVFTFFQQSSLENSIHIAHAFVKARENFQKCIVLENRFLVKDNRERNFDLSSAKFHKNYQKQLSAMKKTSKHLSSARVNLSLQMKTRQSVNLFKKKQSIRERQFSRSKKQEQIEPLQMSNKQLQVIDVSFYGQFMLISLFNREIRLCRLKRSLNKISEQPIFQKSFKDVILYVKLYCSKNKQLFHIVLGLEKDNQSQVIVYRLDDQMKIKEKVFQNQFPFSAKYQSVEPFGLALFNQLGYFAIVELNSSLEGAQQRLYISTQLFNPVTNNRISINQVRINQKLSSIFISCSSGYVYLYDRYIKQIKYQIRICQFPILDISLFHSDQQLLVLYGNGSMALLSTFHLEKIYLYQSYGQISNQSRIYKIDQDHFFIYSQRTIIPYLLFNNQQKQFNNIKSTKILKSRLKLKTRQKKTLQKEKVLRVIEGRGGEQDFLAIILEKGEILMFNTHLEYVGSYYYFKVSHIVQIYSNGEHQFLAIALDNNTVEVVNLYTQNLLFTIKSIQKELLSRNNLRPDSSLHSTSMGKVRTKKNMPQLISIIQFMDVDVSNCFLSIISKGGKVNNYNQKGLLMSVVNLQQRLGEFSQGEMVYDDEELVIASQTNLIVLYRKSYNRKCIIKVSQYPIVQLKKCHLPLYSLCILDSQSSIFLGNAKQKNIKCIHKCIEINKYESLLFNQLMAFRISEQNGTIVRIKEKDETELEINHQKFIVSMINKNILQINKFTGKISIYNFSFSDFQEFIF